MWGAGWDKVSSVRDNEVRSERRPEECREVWLPGGNQSPLYVNGYK